jgi:rSAM/selenodomain-associated transferase 2
MSATPLISIVIPVLHDSSELAALLATLAVTSEQIGGRYTPYEVIVVNGDPGDESIQRLRLRFSEIKWTESLPGRARQMNHGAGLAVGKWLFFLHADACPEPGWIDVLRLVDRTGVVSGAFRFRLRSKTFIARLVEVGVYLRVRLFALPYGDQGIFVRREVFFDEGGYSNLPIMEDIDLVQRLRRRGTMNFPSLAVCVSARRWERSGWVRSSGLNIVLVGLFFAGASPGWLARRYYGARSSHRGVAAMTTHRTQSVVTDQNAASKISVIIPALNEEEAIGHVLTEIPDIVESVTVVDNGSTDRTAECARRAGASVVDEPIRGYGRACLTGLHAESAADIVVFLDADRSDYPEEMQLLLAPILCGTTDFVLGCRDGVGRPLSARFGTALCVWLINRLWTAHYRDLGPFRAITRQALERLRMSDKTWGWTIEMQVKAIEADLRVQEIPIRQRARIGRSKISGTITGSVRAGARMLTTIGSMWWTRHRRRALLRTALDG